MDVVESVSAAVEQCLVDYLSGAWTPSHWNIGGYKEYYEVYPKEKEFEAWLAQRIQDAVSPSFDVQRQYPQAFRNALGNVNGSVDVCVIEPNTRKLILPIEIKTFYEIPPANQQTLAVKPETIFHQKFAKFTDDILKLRAIAETIWETKPNANVTALHVTLADLDSDAANHKKYRYHDQFHGQMARVVKSAASRPRQLTILLVSARVPLTSWKDGGWTMDKTASEDADQRVCWHKF